MPDPWDLPAGQTQSHCQCKPDSIGRCGYCGFMIEPRPATLRRLTMAELMALAVNVAKGRWHDPDYVFARAIEDAIAAKNGMGLEEAP